MKICRVLVLAFALPFAGCGGGDKDPVPPPPVAVDADRDGVADASDCAPNDAQAWQTLNFASRNDDGDIARVNAAGQLCAGANLPPTRFAAAAPAGDVDCDDADANKWATRHYEAVDTDGDGFGVAGTGSLCTGAALPAGFLPTLPASLDLDCDDADAGKWRPLSYASRDVDGDSYRVNATGTSCGQGTLPAALFAQATSIQATDCDDADATRWSWVGLYADADGDGVGAGPVMRHCIGNGNAPAGHVRRGYDPNDNANDPAAATVSEAPIDSSMLTVADDGDDDDDNFP